VSGGDEVVIGVLALQGDVREHLAALAECGVIARPVRRPSELAEVDGLVIPGGESTTISKLAVAFDVFDPIQQRIKEGMPAYGSCAGMIMLAGEVLDGRPDQRSFGGIDMVVRRNAFGRQVDSFEAELDFAGEPLHAVFIRAPWVEEIHGDAEALGRVKDGQSAGKIVAVRQGHLLATSFHPELTGDLRVHRLFVDMVREAKDVRPLKMGDDEAQEGCH
jgi:pyridoxal 5'-phosphate synthase pdxT subunit